MTKMRAEIRRQDLELQGFPPKTNGEKNSKQPLAELFAAKKDLVCRSLSWTIASPEYS